MTEKQLQFNFEALENILPSDLSRLEIFVGEGQLVEIELSLALEGNELVQTGKSIIRVPRYMFKTMENPYAVVNCSDVDESNRAFSKLVSIVQNLGLELGGIGSVTNDKAEFALYRCTCGRNPSQEYSDSVSFMKYIEDKKPILQFQIANQFGLRF